ncbi:MAG: hypothetical protein A3G33_10100 [Omnitrophica bacterium RIFCSPLOWO2_12_FULL_44_17]|uniref:RRM domain-containing protein n=1 Tax=Candidatus Danuiimicrobium aquiferis TaxID=1801832 RepID=A0A1G1L220_9BACT|nr:MAG: hypothetical protein A3B72_08510 [Omnitrophica bacterium RIFCSPHIGHO2_02_FULL_45_28]OGW91294.1 MAG: hypothetical protein A3E74_10025 [Omnitrophica bacterium RIFCSPHIGHO2_12_FULL_44_12]OGW99174.1 MAG: hypothetical protein A3G33_10100 [Omnitrophica bacterium RIFCSPLOWO2_12_FULL_44_17]OGX04410.1 MAG: hypothetical protein A3J12_00510 [Omnitrophica bacterium RIFCSPLOWO2_02_FULL_44_11]
MQTRIFVGNLNFKVTNEDLKQLFESVGSVDSVTLIRDRWSGKPKGYAFVEMVDSESAQKAIELNGHEMMGRSIVVAFANPKDQGKKFRKGGRYDRFRDRKPRNRSPFREKKNLWEKIVSFFTGGRS